MTKVFVGGSRKLSRININVKAKIDAMIQKGYIILVGDANGADKSFQRYLFEQRYGNVIVFCMANGCRNNLGRWEERRIKVNNNKNGFEYYAAKDVEMSKEADYGFMLWDAKSKGTVQNIINLLKSNKRTLVYISSERNFIVLDTLDDIPNLLEKSDIKDRKLIEDKLKISSMLKTRAMQSEFDIIVRS
ncbi:MAG: hypothetical protein ACLFVK_02895 [Dehalococcoidia bacterium]